MLRWFDAHLDLAYLAECGRNMLEPPERAAGPHLPAAVTFPALREGGVLVCLGTIFTEPDGEDAVGYPAGDAERARAVGVRQMERYERWARDGVIALWGHDPRWAQPGLHLPGGSMTPDGDGVPSLGVLIEGADPIRSPDELAWWVGRGVVAIGLTWARSSRYAGGNSTEDGLTDLGRAMIPAMDALGVVHDLSHLSDRAMDELLSRTDRPVMASHSNCRVLLDGKNQRHLRDGSIREIARRGGVIGLNLVRNFIKVGLNRDDPTDRPSIDDAVRHVEYICEVAGHRRAVGLGTDMDGGISADDLPAGIDRPRDLGKISEALRARGWSENEVRGFEFDNWARFFSARQDSPQRHRATQQNRRV